MLMLGTSENLSVVHREQAGPIGLYTKNCRLPPPAVRDRTMPRYDLEICTSPVKKCVSNPSVIILKPKQIVNCWETKLTNCASECPHLSKTTQREHLL